MKRSEINQLMRDAVAFFKAHQFALPGWACYSVKQWKKLGTEADEIRQNQLGWDITDFGLGDFYKTGLLLFTIRNGNLKNPANLKTYGEKVMIVREEQVTPMHFHNSKMEDIINRGGGNLCIQLYNVTAENALSEAPGLISIDGIVRTFLAGEILILKPGESISLPQQLYHKFWGERGKGSVLVGEVSAINDDTADNIFYEKCGRFPAIEEDEAPLYLLCAEYPVAKA
jgi:D-lyxose ketol-isomerase